MFLLRSAVLPINALSDASLDYASFLTWDGNQPHLLGAPDYELLGASIAGDIVIATLRGNPQIPAWQRFVQDALALQDFARSSLSLGAIIFDAIDYQNTTRWLAWTFGSGSRALKRSATDPRFGLLVALNALAAGHVSDDNEPSSHKGVKLSDLRYRQRGPYAQQTGHRSTRGIPLSGFRMDPQSDLLSAVGGHTADPMLVDVLGGRSVRFRADVSNLDDLTRLEAQIVQRSIDDAYRAEFAWVDNVTLIEDEDVIATLRTELANQVLQTPVPPTVDVILPDDLLDVDDTRSIQYVLPPKKWQTQADSTTLTVSQVAYLLRKHGEGHETDGLADELRFLDASRSLIGSQTIFECLSAELSLAGYEYIAYDGDFYRVEPGFVRNIDAEIETIQEARCKLPCYEGSDERTFNTKVGAECSNDFVVLDRSLIYLANQTGVESCDMVGRPGTLIHVKRRGKSSTLSHLFMQAVNSCELLTGSADARDQLRQMVLSSAATDHLKSDILNIADKLDQGHRGLQIVFAFLGDWRGKTVLNLPLFSRISLVQASRRINQLAHIPLVQLVSICV